MSAMTPPTAPAAGSVKSQPTMMRPAVRHRTVEPRRPSPDPITEPEATCVVDSAKPRALEARIVAAVDDSAREALRRLDVGESLAERADDAPAAHVGAEGDRDAAREDHPRLRVGVGTALPAGDDQGERDHAHRLLRVVRAVRERDERGREDLAPAEAVAAVGLRVVAAGDRVREPRRREGDEARGERREDRRQDHLAEHDAVVDRHPAGADDRRADQAAEQGVRRARGQAEQPGEHVPGDRADQAREDQRQERVRIDLILADHAVRDGLGDLGRQERADEVQDGGQQHGDLGLERPGRDGRGHRVGRVVEAVREVEEQRQHDDQHDDQGCGFHRLLSVEGERNVVPT